jgi:hypothetical protein
MEGGSHGFDPTISEENAGIKHKVVAKFSINHLLLSYFICLS